MDAEEQEPLTLDMLHDMLETAGYDCEEPELATLTGAQQEEAADWAGLVVTANLGGSGTPPPRPAFLRPQ